ncbi:MAG: hypothetical protein HY611_09550 [Elusimicrobia bacterium]|nr:hypothetical protein [Elusimicrobiota bacterium]
MMLVVAIIVIMVGIGPRIMIQFQRFLKLTDARDAIQKDARTSLDTINRTLRQGKSSSIVIDQASGQPPYSRVTFTTISDISVTVYQQNKYLYMTRGNTTSVLSRDLRYIAFTFPRSDDPTIVSVSITMERASYEGGTKALELSIEKVRVMN